MSADDEAVTTANAVTASTISAVTRGWDLGEIGLVRLSRIGADAGDTMTATAELLMVKLEWTASAESD